MTDIFFQDTRRIHESDLTPLANPRYKIYNRPRSQKLNDQDSYIKDDPPVWTSG